MRVNRLRHPPGCRDAITNLQLPQRSPAIELHEGMAGGGLDSSKESSHRPCVALGCARIGQRSGARAWFGPWWRTGALADGSRHGAGFVGLVAPLGCAGCGGPAPCLFVNWLLW